MAFQLIDPLAQSFFVEETSHITKVDLYFSSKDSVLPAFVHLRENANGLPGSEIMPFSEVILQPEDITTSVDGSVATSVSFDSPIFLQAGEYSLCVGSSSNNHKVFVSELGQTDDITGTNISSQAYVGKMFRSQSDAQWEALDNDDLKFVLYRGKYAENTPISIDFTVDASTSLLPVILEKNPLEIYPASDVMWVYHENHGMVDGSFVNIKSSAFSKDLDGVYPTVNGIDMEVFQTTNFQIANASRRGYSITLPSAVTGVTVPTRIGGAVTSASHNYLFDEFIPEIAQIKDPAVTVIKSYKSTTSDYSVDSTFTPINDSVVKLSQSRILAGEVTKANNMASAESFTFRMTFETEDENTTPVIDTQKFRLLTMKNLIDNPTYATEHPLAFHVDDFITSTSLTITQTTGTFGEITVPAGNQPQAKTLTNGTILTLTEGTNVGQFRIIDINPDGDTIEIQSIGGTDITTETAVYTITNGNRFIADEAATGSSTGSQYITRQIDFDNPSTSINVRVDVSRPSGCDIELYYKTQLVGESGSLDNKEYTRIAKTFPTTVGNDFVDSEVQLDDLPPFESMILKIIFKSDDSAIIPRCKNLRIISLA